MLAALFANVLATTAPFFGDHEIVFLLLAATNKIVVCIFSTASILVGLSGPCALAFLNALEHKRSSFVRVFCAFVSATYENRIASLFVRFASLQRQKLYLFRLDNK